MGDVSKCFMLVIFFNMQSLHARQLVKGRQNKFIGATHRNAEVAAAYAQHISCYGAYQSAPSSSASRAALAAASAAH